MRSGTIMFIAVLLVAGAAAAAPEIANVAGPVNHWEPFLVFGEGFDEPQCTVVAWAPKEQQDPKDLLPRILSGGLPRPPEEPPEGSVVGLYGRVRSLSPQVLAAVMQGEAAVLWVRSARGTSKPYAVNRPQPYFLEYETAAPGAEIRVFGRNLCRAYSAGPRPRMFLVARAGGRVFEATRGAKHDYQGHLDYQLAYEVCYRLPADLPEGAYDVWVHHGAYGPLGFAGPLGLAVRSEPPPKKPVFDVTKHGAKGDAVADDTAAIEQALLAAAEGGGVVFLPAGTYLISWPLRVLPGVDLKGANRATTFLVARPEKFQGGFPAGGLPEKARAVAAAFRHAAERPMLYAVSDTTVSDLSLLGNDQTGFNILLESPAGPVHDVTVTRCEAFNPCTPLVTKEWLPAAAINTYGGGERIEISWCDLRAINGIGGGTRRCRTLYNTFSPPRGPYGTNQIGCQIGEECLIEGNVCREANRGYTCGPWGGPVQHNFIVRNRFLDAGSVEGGGESILFECGEVGGENWLGHPARVGPSHIEQQDQKWPPHVLKGRTAMVVGGRGFGQVRTVADNTESRATLSEPWRIAPGADSWIVVRQFAYQNVLLNNLCRDTLQGIQMSGALDNVVDRFIGLRSGFGVWFPAFNAPKGERLYYSPSALNEVRNCIFTDTPSAVVFSGDRELAVLRQPLPLTFGNLVRGNQFIHGEAKSYGGVITNSSWLAADDARRQDAPPHAAFNAFGGNSFDPLAGKPAFNFDKCTFGSPLWLNKTGERPTAAPAQAAGSVVFPSP
ncbi:MAG: glycosyl hydrolase family 28-related protein [Thermoguttaceae bacterium]